MPLVPRGQAEHIKLNAGNVLAIGLLSVLWVGFADWSTAWLARTDIPFLAQLSAGGQAYLHGTVTK
jgi:hypothetical protein